MPVRTGTADLPLHGGRVPAWMLRIMKKLAGAIVTYMVEARGPDAVLSMLADPAWFQAFNNVIGMDWDSSGSTTVVLGVLKSVSWSGDLGFLVLGGKGGRMRLVPSEAAPAEERLGVPAGRIEEFSRAAARIDSALLQDGYDLYIHGVVVSSTGRIVVVQQGMNPSAGMARRYHLASASLAGDPHSGIAGKTGQVVLDASTPRARQARKAYLDVVGEGPRRFERLLREANRRALRGVGLEKWLSPGVQPRERRPYYAPVRPSKHLIRAIERLASYPLSGEDDLLRAPGLGPKTVRALALIADIIYGVPTPTEDPVTHPLDPYLYAYAIGGKDGVPYKFDARTALEAYRFLEEALESSRLEASLRDKALRRLRRRLRNLIK